MVLLVKSLTILTVKNVANFNLGFRWNATQNAWSALGRWHQSCKQCQHQKSRCAKHPINSIAYSWNAADADSFVGLDVPPDVRTTNIGEPKWIQFHGHAAILSHTNGEALSGTGLAFDPQLESSHSAYKSYVIQSIPFGNAIPIQYGKRIEELNPTAKNFLFFASGNDTYIVTLVQPHKIYKWNDDGMIEPKYSSWCSNCSFFSDVPHFLSAGPVLVEGVGWLAGGHSAYGAFGGYRMSYFYVFRDSPPFDILCLTPDMSFGHSTHLEYMTNIELFDRDLYISLGVDDCHSVLVKVPLAKVLERCTPEAPWLASSPRMARQKTAGRQKRHSSDEGRAFLGMAMGESSTSSGSTPSDSSVMAATSSLAAAGAVLVLPCLVLSILFFFAYYHRTISRQE